MRITQEAKSGTLKVLGDYLRKNPQFVYKGSMHTKGISNVVEKGCAHLAVRFVAANYLKMTIQ